MFLLPYLCMLGIVVSSSLIIPQSIKLFFKIASAYSSGDSDETFLFQFLVHFPYQLVGVGLGDTQLFGHLLCLQTIPCSCSAPPHFVFANMLMFMCSLYINTSVNVKNLFRIFVKLYLAYFAFLRYAIFKGGVIYDSRR